MKPLDDAQLAELQRREESGYYRRSQTVALGIMFGAEGAVAGAGIGLAAGALWFLTAIAGVAAAAVGYGLVLLIPARTRREWGVRMFVPQMDPERVRRSASIEGVNLVQREKKPYWPQ